MPNNKPQRELTPSETQHTLAWAGRDTGFTQMT